MTYNYHLTKEDESIDSTGINIELKEFLATPTVLAIVYYTLRKSENST